MSVSLNAAIKLAFTQTNTYKGVTTTSTPTVATSFQQGTGVAANTQDQLWLHIGRTLVASASEELDLAAGLVDGFGTTLTFVKIKGLWIRNTNTAAGDTLAIGGSAANAFLLFDSATDIYTLGPGGLFLINEPSLAGKAVTAATGDLLKLTETGAANTCTFDVCIWGTSA